MSAQRFGAVYFSETNKSTWQTVMTGTPLFDKTAMISFCNQSMYPATIFLAYVVDPAVTEPKQEDYLVFSKTIQSFETYYHPALAVSEEARIFVYSDIAGTSVVAHGYRDEI